MMKSVIIHCLLVYVQHVAACCEGLRPRSYCSQNFLPFEFYLLLICNIRVLLCSDLCVSVLSRCHCNLNSVAHHHDLIRITLFSVYSTFFQIPMRLDYGHKVSLFSHLHQYSRKSPLTQQIR